MAWAAAAAVAHSWRWAGTSGSRGRLRWQPYTRSAPSGQSYTQSLSLSPTTHYTPVLGEVLGRSSRPQRHLRYPSLRAQRAVVRQPSTCIGGGGGGGGGEGCGIGGARLAQPTAVVARLLELAHTVVWRRQFVARGAGSTRGATCRATRVLGRIGAHVVGGRRHDQHHAAAALQMQRTSTALGSARSMGPGSARVWSPSVELGKRPRLCGHVVGSVRR